MNYPQNCPSGLIELYTVHFGVKPASVIPLPQGGGNRIYFRMRSEGNRDVIGVRGSDVDENKAFIYICNALKVDEIQVPEIYAVSPDYEYYLLQDLGDVSLFSLLSTSEGDKYLNKAVESLPKLQMVKGIDWNQPFLQKPFGKRLVMADLNYFKYCYLKPCDILFSEERLEDDFEAFCRDIIEASARLEGFMYRDCQSRNVMVHDDSIWWIDFQGARKGPMLYDIVSLLWQAKAGFTKERRQSLLDLYFSSLEKFVKYPVELREKDVKLFALFRTLQVLGAYGFRGLVQRRAHFLNSIPPALKNLRDLIADGAAEKYPELNRVLRVLSYPQPDTVSNENSGKLRVEVVSFSYKKGYPTDNSGNGGGFMFDCRAIHNPGRYEEYKDLTGFHDEVAAFLMKQNETHEFLSSAYQLVDASVERYLSRGFTNLQVGFGCTGGQHRSVFCAEKMAQHLKDKYGTRLIINLIHREQKVNKTI